MRILVPVKQVARLRHDYAPDGSAAVPPEALEWRLDECDECSLQAALELRDAHGEGEVVVVTVGAERSEQALRACLAKGADRAVRIWDDELEGADPLAVARVLGALARREEPQLILCGVQSSDAANAATGVALAGLLGLARAASVSSIAHAGGHLGVQRELDGGAVEVLRLALPALVTVTDAIAQPRAANLRALKQAREKPLEAIGVAALDLDAGEVRAASGARIVRLLERDRGKRASMIEGPPAAIAERIVELLTEATSR